MLHCLRLKTGVDREVNILETVCDYKCVCLRMCVHRRVALVVSVEQRWQNHRPSCCYSFWKIFFQPKRFPFLPPFFTWHSLLIFFCWGCPTGPVLKWTCMKCGNTVPCLMVLQVRCLQPPGLVLSGPAIHDLALHWLTLGMPKTACCFSSGLAVSFCSSVNFKY